MVRRLALRDKPATGLPVVTHRQSVLEEVSAHSHCTGRKCPQKNIRRNNYEVREFFQLSKGNKKPDWAIIEKKGNKGQEPGLSDQQQGLLKAIPHLMKQFAR